MTHSPLANPKATQDVLRHYGLDAKHALGQNFLIDDNIIGRILELARPVGCVLEVGPGIGTLSTALLERGPVIAVERDPDLPLVLAETTAVHSERFALICNDALKMGWSEVEQAAKSIDVDLPTQLIANLPYNIAATLILGWFERFDSLESMTVMVQSEVADRICASQGTKSYGSYSIKLRLWARVSGRFQVSPSCFLPPPHVDSAVIRLERVALCDDPAVVRTACDIADAAFAQRRKNIRNSMKSRYEVSVIDSLLEQVGIEPTLRAETLGAETFIKLAEALLDLQSH